MQRFYETVFDTLTGAAVSGAQVFVYKSDGNLATIYEDAAGTQVAQNPMVSDSNGFVACYAPDGVYNLDFANNGVIMRSIEGIPIFDLADMRADVDALQAALPGKASITYVDSGDVTLANAINALATGTYTKAQTDAAIAAYVAAHGGGGGGGGVWGTITGTLSDQADLAAALAAISTGGPTFSGCKLNLTATQNITAADTAIPINWTTEAFDAGNWHESIVNPSRITVPVGVTKCRVDASLVRDNNSSSYHIVFISHYDSTGTLKFAYRSSLSTSGVMAWVQCTTGVCDVVAGDYFVVSGQSGSGGGVGPAWTTQSWVAAVAIAGPIADALAKSSNLSDLTNKATARTNLSVYSKAEADALVAGAKPWYWRPPHVADFAGTIAGVTVTDDTDVGLIIRGSGPFDATRGPFMALPAWTSFTSWQCTLRINAAIYAVNYAEVGLAVYNDDRSKNYLLAYDARNFIHFFRQNATGFDSFEQASPVFAAAGAQIRWLRYTYDGSTGYVTCEWSYDGKAWLTTPTVIGTRNLLPVSSGKAGTTNELGVGMGPSWIGPAIVCGSYSYDLAATVDHFKLT
jgi:hypothetical protein